MVIHLKVAEIFQPGSKTAWHLHPYSRVPTKSSDGPLGENTPCDWSAHYFINDSATAEGEYNHEG